MENKILDKLRKLLLHKQSAEEIGSTAEAEAFAIKIQKLLNEYNLSLSDIDLEDRKTNIVREKGLDAKSKGFKGRSSYLVMNVIAKHNWCRAYSTGFANTGIMSIIGSKENVEICKYLHSILYPLSVKLGRKEYNDFLKNDVSLKLGLIKKPSRGKYLRAFINGFADGLSVKFQEEKNKFKVEYTGASSLIVCNDKMLAEFEQKEIGKINTFKTKISKVGNANAKGFEAGKNVDITKGIVSRDTNSKKIQ